MEDSKRRLVAFSRGGTTALGKCTATLKTHLPDVIDEEFRELAQRMGCSPSELLYASLCVMPHLES